MVPTTFIGPPAVGNWEGGRIGNPIDMIVIHTMVGTVSTADQRFKTAGQQASAHYGIDFYGETIAQWVREQDTSYHAGDFPVNLRSIGIEHEDRGLYNDPRPLGLYVTSAQLVHDICHRYGIPIDREHIKGHREVSDRPTSCPDSLDVDRIVAMALAIDGPHPVPPKLSPSMLNSREEDMQTYRLDSTNPDAFWPGFFQGKPGPYPERDVFVSICGDTFAGTPDSVVKVFWVPVTGMGAVELDVHVAGSQEVTVQCPLAGEVHVRVNLSSGGPVWAKTYVEFKL